MIEFKFSHFCIGDDALKEVDPSTSEVLLDKLTNDVDWNRADYGINQLIPIIEEMEAFDISFVSDGGAVWKSADVLVELKKEASQING